MDIEITLHYDTETRKWLLLPRPESGVVYSAETIYILADYINLVLKEKIKEQQTLLSQAIEAL